MPNTGRSNRNSGDGDEAIRGCSDAKSCPIPQITLVFVKDLAENVRGVSSQVQELGDCMQRHAVSLGALKAEFDALRCNVEGLTKIVRDGNGQPSLMSRVSVVEIDLKNQADDLESANNDFREYRKERQDDKRHNFAMWVAVLAAVISALGGAFSILGK